MRVVAQAELDERASRALLVGEVQEGAAARVLVADLSARACVRARYSYMLWQSETDVGVRKRI